MSLPALHLDGKTSTGEEQYTTKQHKRKILV